MPVEIVVKVYRGEQLVRQQSLQEERSNIAVLMHKKYRSTFRFNMEFPAGISGPGGKSMLARCHVSEKMGFIA